MSRQDQEAFDVGEWRLYEQACGCPVNWHAGLSLWYHTDTQSPDIEAVVCNGVAMWFHVPKEQAHDLVVFLNAFRTIKANYPDFDDHIRRLEEDNAEMLEEIFELKKQLRVMSDSTP